MSAPMYDVQLVKEFGRCCESPVQVNAFRVHRYRRFYSTSTRQYHTRGKRYGGKVRLCLFMNCWLDPVAALLLNVLTEGVLVCPSVFPCKWFVKSKWHPLIQELSSHPGSSSLHINCLGLVLISSDALSLPGSSRSTDNQTPGHWKNPKSNNHKK